MAITETLVSNKLTIRLNNGQSESGAQKTVSQGLPSLKKTTWNSEADNVKAMAVVSAYEDIFALPIYDVRLTRINGLEEE